MNPRLKTGSENAIRLCLSVQPSDRVVIITDDETMEIGQALQSVSQTITQSVMLIKIEDYIKRPAKELPYDFVQNIRNFNPTVSIYAAQGQIGEIQVFRSPLVKFLTQELKCRHAHMIGVTGQLMEDGMNKDYARVFKVTNNVFNKVSNATKLLVKDDYGTDITFILDPTNLKWIQDNGRIGKGEMRNLPAGEVFTSPLSAKGTIIAWELGDWMCKKYGELKTPLKLDILNGLVFSVSPVNRNDSVAAEASEIFSNYITEFENGNRVGELGLGTLIGLTKFVGNLLQDEKFPGVHMALGHPYPEETGANWDSPSHIDVIAKSTTVTVEHTDGTLEVIMRNGVYSTDILK
ncbi:hypothetical protein C4561_05200 [candidate division WWE3 bacterium]|jgi:leucyl aminopeptidase (aminopeptidase T)|uniref:Aminopeptidase n=1 Tax=candidate division WWE3 bacterium TaxID=2053526 RepID=A0A3A4ZB18_UNCKA|nr:MAG: hypothetical protein C4561_05200 [candidate division WWE3 bacterium]